MMQSQRILVGSCSFVTEHGFATKKTPGPRPLAVNYVEDEIRHQFFRDHPFESFRSRSLTETGIIKDEHAASINGRWSRTRTGPF